MLVRIVEEYTRGAMRWSPGCVLDVEDDEARVLIEEGSAVPVTDTFEAERRSRSLPGRHAGEAAGRQVR